MKYFIAVFAIILFASAADAGVICTSMQDPTWQACFPGYMCPAGYYQSGGAC